MKTQGLAWFAAGVLALGVNGTFQDNGPDWAHQIVDRISDRTTALVDRTSEQADRLLIQARLMARGESNSSCRAAAAVARIQSRMARTQIAKAETDVALWESMSDKDLAQFERFQAHQQEWQDKLAAVRNRLQARTVRLRFATAQFDPVVVNVPVNCPRVRVNGPRVHVVVPNVNIRVPEVEVDTRNSDPI